LYLVYENPDAILPEDVVKAYVEIDLDKERLLKLPSEEILLAYLEPALVQLQKKVVGLTR